MSIGEGRVERGKWKEESGKWKEEREKFTKSLVMCEKMCYFAHEKKTINKNI